MHTVPAMCVAVAAKLVKPWMTVAAKLVKPSTITKCFLHAGFPKELMSDTPDNVPEDTADVIELTDLLSATAAGLDLQDPLPTTQKCPID